MTPNYTKTIKSLLDDIRTYSRGLPKGQANIVANRCDKLELTIKKKDIMDTRNEQTNRQIADRYNAKKAIFHAMMQGRHISFLDSKEFEVSQMHTQICSIRKDIEDHNLPYTMKDRWMEFGRHGKRCKEYWLEDRRTQA